MPEGPSFSCPAVQVAPCPACQLACPVLHCTTASSVGTLVVVAGLTVGALLLGFALGTAFSLRAFPRWEAAAEPLQLVQPALGGPRTPSR